ncbi:MAG: adenosylcobinamide-GDP ribazoletransferase [Alphaproteobacteria bacterium]|nr:adenosylcobinamide-GDP ribazoletransferase [Alphaproteobacteria bacterium]
MNDQHGRVRYPAGLLAGFAVATAFLTQLPVDPRARGTWQLAGSAWAFPLVGGGIGAAVAVVFFVAQLSGLADLPAASIAVLAGVALTGALHEDGLADTADGLLGGRDREATLTIMRDSRHGTFGVLAILLSVLLRAAALASIGDAVHGGLALVAAHAVSRAALPVAMRTMSPARTDGLGAAAGAPSVPGLAGAAVIGILVGLSALGPMRGAIGICLAGVTVWAVARIARRRIGGYTGDILGGFQQIAEIVMLLTASAK